MRFKTPPATASVIARLHLLHGHLQLLSQALRLLLLLADHLLLLRHRRVALLQVLQSWQSRQVLLGAQDAHAPSHGATYFYVFQE